MHRKNLLENELDEYKVLLDRIDYLVETIESQIKELNRDYYSYKITTVKNRRALVQKEIDAMTQRLIMGALSRNDQRRNNK